MVESFKAQPIGRDTASAGFRLKCKRMEHVPACFKTPMRQLLQRQRGPGSDPAGSGRRCRGGAAVACPAQNADMKRILKWMFVAGLALLLLLAAGAWALQGWLGTEDFKARAEREASALLGVAVKLERIDVDLWPLPALALGGIQIQTRPPLTLERLELRPTWRSLMQGRLELASVLVRRAMLAQSGLDAVLTSLQKKKHATPTQQGLEAGNASSLDYIPRRVLLEQVTWVSAKGAPMTLDVDALLSAQGVPDEVSVKVMQGQLQGAKARLQRQGHDWTLAMELGGGSVKGTATLQPAAQAGAEFSLKGQLQTRAVEVAALSGTARPVLSGRLEADTSFSAHSASLGALADGLQTQSKFTVQHAVLHGIDLAQAVKTVGLSRGGETHLDTLAGQLHSHGRALQFSNLVASSGVLSASGNVAVAASHALSGRVRVDLAASALGTAVGVPLVVGGTLEAPEVTVTRGALIGAAIGTVLMPGVGTGAGVSLGDQVGAGLKKFFGK